MNIHAVRGEAHKKALNKVVYVVRPTHGGYWWGTIVGLDGEHAFIVRDEEGAERSVSIFDIRYPDEEQLTQKFAKASTPQTKIFKKRTIRPTTSISTRRIK